jgi:hypothetical protein
LPSLAHAAALTVGSIEVEFLVPDTAGLEGRT